MYLSISLLFALGRIDGVRHAQDVVEVDVVVAVIVDRLSRVGQVTSRIHLPRHVLELRIAQLVGINESLSHPLQCILLCSLLLLHALTRRRRSVLGGRGPGRPKQQLGETLGDGDDTLLVGHDHCGCGGIWLFIC